MSDSSPLIPRGSLLEQQAKGRPHLRIALCIVAGHLVFLGGLLMQGCKRDDPGDLASGTGLPTLELTNTIAPLPLDVRPPVPEPAPLPVRREPEPVTLPVPLTPPPPLDVAPVWRIEDPAPVREPVVPPPVPAPAAVREHTVVQGDTFYALAQRYGVTAGDIARANPQVDATRLRVGQKLIIPAPGPTPERATVRGTDEGTYVVKRGDTLTRIAQQHGTTVEALKQMNNLVTDRIVVDQRLRVPTAPTRPGPGGN